MKIYVLAGWKLNKLYPYHRASCVLIVFYGTYKDLCPLQKELYSMNKTNYISVCIDVGSAFSLMSIVDQHENVILKPFKIIHNNPNSLARAVSAIKKQNSRTP